MKQRPFLLEGSIQGQTQRYSAGASWPWHPCWHLPALTTEPCATPMDVAVGLQTWFPKPFPCCPFCLIEQPAGQLPGIFPQALSCHLSWCFQGCGDRSLILHLTSSRSEFPNSYLVT